MKKKYFLLFFVFIMAVAEAQDVSQIPFHSIGYNYFTIENLMQQRDGDILTCVYFENPEATPVVRGNVFIKMSPATLQFTDSLLLADTVTPYYLFARDPRGEGNIRANLEYAEDKDSTFLRICRFPDNDLHANHNEDVLTPLCDGMVVDYIDSYMTDCRGDMIMKYYKELPDGNFEGHIARIDPDGTMKHEAMIPQSQNFVINMKTFRESPLEYYQWRRSSGSNLTLYVIDSLFQTKNTIVVNKVFKEEPIAAGCTAYEYFNINSHTQVVADGEDILIAAEYTSDTNFNPLQSEHGLAVARYDLRTMQQKNMIQFNDWPGTYTDATCLGLHKMSDGAIYLLYSELTPQDRQMTFAVKMDPDFNVEWKHYCKLPDNIILFRTAYCIPAEDYDGNEVMAIAGDSGNSDDYSMGIFYFFLTHDGTIGVNESNMEVRPYMFYPNPAKDRLRFQYSPDVQPKQVELHALQGRLVHTQSGSFESINLSRLPAGTYMLRVTMEDGRSYTDKVVKE